ncbi:MAG TPA: hypothetical protein VJM51_00720, partial [Dehalococcoidia bacterium]|nr:hypothetical protein [Dehalococcoidia bacterium]
VRVAVGGKVGVAVGKGIDVGVVPAAERTYPGASLRSRAAISDPETSARPSCPLATAGGVV